MLLRNRLTEKFGIDYPIVLAPMDYVSDWRLANAVADAGGLGILGGGYGDSIWLKEQFAHDPNERLGVGFITWSMAQQPGLLDMVIAHRPSNVFLSFSDPAPHAPAVLDAGIPLICQVHNIEQARRAIHVGASVICAQGGEGGGHGMGVRSTFTLVPEIADLLRTTAPEVMLLAAGGIGDGRGLAASLALGADGAVVGTRFATAAEAALRDSAQQRALEASGDHTIRQQAFDVVRRKAWPSQYTGRVLRNAFIDRWHGNESDLSMDLDEQRRAFEEAVEGEDYGLANVIVGEVIGLIDSVNTAASIIAEMVGTASSILGRISPNAVLIDATTPKARS
jgi:nitronate monooxygenase